MLLKSEEIYSKFNEENIQVVIPKKYYYALYCSRQIDFVKY
ncbi:hypothetical protein [Acetivibrio saccincola]|nr:hypothetical protein [Acetivibrio saccincola]